MAQEHREYFERDYGYYAIGWGCIFVLLSVSAAAVIVVIVYLALH